MEKGLESKLCVIRYEFTKKELAVHSSNIAERIAETEALVNKKKSFDSQMSLEIKALEMEIKKLASESRDGFKMCSHPCYEMFDFETKQVFIHREDTDVRVDARTMTSDEFQRDIFNPTEGIEIDQDLPESVQMAIRMKFEHPAQFTQACKELKFNPGTVEKFVDASAIPVCERVKAILEAEDEIPDEKPPEEE